MTKKELAKMKTNIQARMITKVGTGSYTFDTILSDDEKEYVKEVIKGYEDKLIGLKKERTRWGTYIIAIPEIIDGVEMKDYVSIMGHDTYPVVKFLRNNAQGGYKSMIGNRLYTFEELGICFNKTQGKRNSILDSKEKEYLSAVIKPFRDRIYTIKKHVYPNRTAFINIRMQGEVLKETFADMDLPLFKANTMYKGMEADKEYTLEELGL